MQTNVVEFPSTIKVVNADVGAARPYKTLYFDAGRSAGWAKVGAAASEKGAIRAAVVRVFERQYTMAEVYEHGVLIHTIRRTPSGISIHYGSS